MCLGIYTERTTYSKPEYILAPSVGLVGLKYFVKKLFILHTKRQDLVLQRNVLSVTVFDVLNKSDGEVNREKYKHTNHQRVYIVLTNI